jgi:hypothetical protein
VKASDAGSGITRVAVVIQDTGNPELDGSTYLDEPLRRISGSSHRGTWRWTWPLRCGEHSSEYWGTVYVQDRADNVARGYINFKVLGR